MDNNDANALMIFNVLARIADAAEANLVQTAALMEYWRIGNENNLDLRSKRDKLFPLEEENYKLSLANFKLNNELIELQKAMYNGA